MKMNIITTWTNAMKQVRVYAAEDMVVRNTIRNKTDISSGCSCPGCTSLRVEYDALWKSHRDLETKISDELGHAYKLADTARRETATLKLSSELAISIAE